MLDTKQLTNFELYILNEALIEYSGEPFERVYLDAKRELKDSVTKEWNERLAVSMIKS